MATDLVTKTCEQQARKRINDAKIALTKAAKDLVQEYGLHAQNEDPAGSLLKIVSGTGSDQNLVAGTTNKIVEAVVAEVANNQAKKPASKTAKTSGSSKAA